LGRVIYVIIFLALKMEVVKALNFRTSDQEDLEVSADSVVLEVLMMELTLLRYLRTFSRMMVLVVVLDSLMMMRMIYLPK
jgi:hypothetical protein